MNSRQEQKDEYSYDLIGLAMEVHRELGPGLDERFCHQLLASKLDVKDIPYRFKPHGKLIHRGLLYAEFNWAGISCVVNPLVTVCTASKVLGHTHLECLTIFRS